MRRVTAPNGVVYYESERLAAIGVRHAFSTRIGGVSPAPFASLNLGNPAGIAQPDSPDNLAENHRRVHVAAGLPAARTWVTQVHGCGVVLPNNYSPGDPGDAILGFDPEVTLVVRSADCATILLASADGTFIATVHAGWRGVVAGIMAATVEGMRRLNAPPASAAIFPCISYDHFEVGLEVVAAFQARDLPARRVSAEKGRAAVPESCQLQLQRLGVTDIDMPGTCTYANAVDFFSHRRDAGITGRMALLAAPAGKH